MSACLRLLATLVACLPWRALGLLGHGLGLLAGSLLRIRRASVEEAMRLAEVGDVPRAARAMYASLGRGVFELLWLRGASARRRDRALATHVRWDDGAFDVLDAALARGPVVLAAGHTGNWEAVAFAAARLLAHRGRRLVVVAKPFSARGFDGFVSALRSDLGVVVVPPDGAARACLDALRRGDVVVMPVDQVPESRRHAVAVHVFGRAAWADRAPATIAARAGAAMLAVVARREGGTQHVRVAAVLRPREAGAEGTTRAATAVIEAFARVEPASFMWLHRRWREPIRVSRPRSTFPTRTPA